jgi:hypothetical protein
MPRDTTSRDWFIKAETDYFSAFIKLWLSFNSLYRRDYRNRNFGKIDRKYIEILKTENNPLKERFRKLFEEELNEAREFKVHLIELIRKYDGGLFGQKTIQKTEYAKPQMNGIALDEISFKDFIHPRSIQLMKNPKKDEWIKIDKLYIKKLPDETWPYFIEVLYMVRCLLIHGEMEPTEENHEIIKNCYFVLSILIKDEV